MAWMLFLIFVFIWWFSGETRRPWQIQVCLKEIVSMKGLTSCRRQLERCKQKSLCEFKLRSMKISTEKGIVMCEGPQVKYYTPGHTWGFLALRSPRHWSTWLACSAFLIWPQMSKCLCWNPYLLTGKMNFQQGFAKHQGRMRVKEAWEIQAHF